MTLIIDILERSPIIPVVDIDDASHALPLAEALLEGGISVLEITLRTEPALDAIELIAKTLPDIAVGAGTVLDADQFQRAVNTGANFIVSPGASDEILSKAEFSDVAFLPGGVTPSELMKLRSAGYTYVKFFPAEASGGTRMLSALKGPFKGLSFCPTGGISEALLNSYLELDNVVCVGGSWLTPKQALHNADWTTITELAKISGHTH